jgi:cytochrome c
MVYQGLKDEKRIDDLIAFLKQFDSSGKKTSALLRQSQALAAQ